ncbi:MAG: aminotransferase class III-fold pyridoxal phosphate-dependent enzyme, partial [Planctomycetota bacterium]
AAGIATIETIEQDGLLERAGEVAQRFRAHLDDLVEQCPHIREIRQAGLMIGIELDVDATDIVGQCLQDGLLINCTQGNVLRLLPAMNISNEQIDRGMEKLASHVLRFVSQLAAPATEPGAAFATTGHADRSDAVTQQQSESTESVGADATTGAASSSDRNTDATSPAVPESIPADGDD